MPRAEWKWKFSGSKSGWREPVLEHFWCPEAPATTWHTWNPVFFQPIRAEDWSWTDQSQVSVWSIFVVVDPQPAGVDSSKVIFFKLSHFLTKCSQSFDNWINTKFEKPSGFFESHFLKLHYLWTIRVILQLNHLQFFF